ncbi:MAG TPA: hypothetical protein VGM68_10950 [Rhizomicrobium sp.]|jgi:hypothetical protein
MPPRKTDPNNKIASPRRLKQKAEEFRPPSQQLPDYEAVAKLLAPNPPPWLSGYLKRWAPSIFLHHGVEQRQPTRAEMREILIEIVKSAGLLQRAIIEPSVQEFLSGVSTEPLELPVKFQSLLGELKKRADLASQSPILVDHKGKTKGGRNRAFPVEAISAQTYCALLIAEVWKWFRGDYPAPRNRQAQKSAEIYWHLANGPRQGWGNDTLAAWRYHIGNALKTKEKERTEFRRHLRESERSNVP